jgi:replicative DNA helicase
MMNELDFRKWKDNLLHGQPPKRINIGEDFASVPVRPGQVLIIGAPPGAGKTSLVMSWTFDALYLQADLRAVVLNVDMPTADLLDREVARQSGVGATDIDNRLFRNQAEYQTDVVEAIEKIGTIKDRLQFVPPPFTLEHVAKVISEHNADLIILDYLQMITPDGKPVKDLRTTNNVCLASIRKIANWGKAVIVVSSVARDKGSKGRAYENLSLGSFKESGEIEFGADNCFILSMDGERGVLNHFKHRHAKGENVYLTFNGDCHQWSKSVKREVEL